MERSSFFNAILDAGGNPDRSYLASDYARYFSSFIGNGVFPNPSTGLQVMANDDMTVTIPKGKAWINGYFYENRDDLIFTLEPADGVLNRIDRIALQLDYDGAREIKAVVKQGAFASSPAPKELQRDADIYEIALADVYVGKGIISIGQANITDLRLDNELCGIVHGVVDQVDVTTLYNQYTQGFEHKKEEFEQEFMSWFDTLQDVLDENIASNLLNMINSVSNDLDEHKAESTQQAHLAKNIGLEDTAGNFTATEIEGAMSELFTNVSDGKDLVGGAITGVDDSVVIPTDPTFGDLASAIGSISTGKKWASGNLPASPVPNNEYTVSNLQFKPNLVITYIYANGYPNFGYTSVGIRSPKDIGIGENTTSFFGMIGDTNKVAYPSSFLNNGFKVTYAPYTNHQTDGGGMWIAYE